MRLRVYLSELAFGYLRREPLKLTLTIFGLALGVAVLLAVRLNTEAAVRSFEQSSEFVRGFNASVISSPTGSLTAMQYRSAYDVLAQKHRFAPVSMLHTELAKGELQMPVQVLGIDLLHPPQTFGTGTAIDRNHFTRLLSEPRTLLASASLANAGERISLLANGATIEFEVVATLDTTPLAQAYGGHVVVMDLSTYNEEFVPTGFVNQILVFELTAHAADRIQAELPTPLRIRTGDEENGFARKATSAFRLNLTFLGAVALLASALLIFNTVSAFIVLRKRDYAILLSLGEVPRNIFRLLLAEVVVLGAAGSILGIPLGMLFATLTYHHVANTVTALYMPIATGTLSFPLSEIVGVALVGPAVAVCSALIPASELLRSDIRSSLSALESEMRFRTSVVRLSAFGALALGIAYILSDPSLLRFHPIAGLLPAVFLLAGALLIIPHAFSGYLSCCRFVLRHSFSALLATDHLTMTLRRNAISAAAIVLTIGMFLGVATMIRSFRDTVERWITHITTADIYISNGGVAARGSGSPIPERLYHYAISASNVLDSEFLSTMTVELNGASVLVHGVDIRKMLHYGRLLPVEQSPELEGLLQASEAVLVSEPFASRSRLRIGDKIDVPGSRGSRTFTVAMIFYDYSSEQGVAYLPIEQHRALFEKASLDAFSLYVRGAPEALIAELRREFPLPSLNIRDNKALRRQVLDVFDATFRVTYSLQLVALVVCAFTVLNTIAMLIAERKREFAVLFAVGASQRQLIRLVLVEATLLGIFSSVCGALLGVALQALLVFVVNRFFFGWSITLSPAYDLYLATTLLVVVASAAVALLPARRNAGTLNSEALRYE